MVANDAILMNGKFNLHLHSKDEDRIIHGYNLFFQVTLKGAKDCVKDARQRIEDLVLDLESQVSIECHIEQVCKKIGLFDL